MKLFFILYAFYQIQNVLACEYNTSCVYGELNTVKCSDKLVTFPCLYCWQLPQEQYTCIEKIPCKTRYLTTCTVKNDTHCLGRREFKKYQQCDIDSTFKWSTALTASILFGGFGVDRFYLGHWQEGLAKLFSFGGFGIWTFIDAILITIGYLKPSGEM